MEKYIVTGMSCAACQARVEKAVSGLEGVNECSVSLLTNSMMVDGDVSAETVIGAVEKAGYGASLMKKSGGNSAHASGNLAHASDKSAHAFNSFVQADRNSSAINDPERINSSIYAEEEEMLRDKESPVLKKRLISSIVFLIILMYFSMGHMMFGFPLPKFFEGNHVAMGLFQMLLTIIIMIINSKFFVSGFKGLFHGSPNMDSLVALGSSASFIYSVAALFMMTDAVVKYGPDAGSPYMDKFYFESAAMILTLITVGKLLEAMSKGRTTDALKSLMKLSPKTAVIILDDGSEKEVPVDEVMVGDIFAVKPGENIPVDGVVVEGVSAINEAALTGESIPVDKEVGDNVSSATTNTSGFLKCRATRVGRDTTLSQIIQMVSDASATKAPIAKIADKVSGIFVPVVIGIALITFIIWILVGREIGFALSRAIAVLVISCPCALGLATPVAIMVGNGVGAKNGILFKTASSLENTGKTQIVALDKTGTITKGEPVVTDIVVDNENVNIDNTDGTDNTGGKSNSNKYDELIHIAYILEKKSEHPLAKAIVNFVEENEETLNDQENNGLLHNSSDKVLNTNTDKDTNTVTNKWFVDSDNTITDFTILPGNGLSAIYKGRKIVGGSLKYIRTECDLTPEMEQKAEELSEAGKTPLFFAQDKKILGIIAVADPIKEDSAKAISELKSLGIKTVMITGDNLKTAKAIGKEAGVDEIIAEVLPEGKEEVIANLSGHGKVAMIGDGINDAPALTRADTGIAIGAGTDVAIDAADVVLMKNSLMDAVRAIKLSKTTLRNIHQNLFWAFFYNVLGIPLAAGAYIHAFGWELNPMFAAAAMSLSSFFVVTNALRLNLIGKKIFS